MQVNHEVKTDIGQAETNEEMQNCGCDNAIRYEIDGKPYAWYHRLKDVHEFDYYELITGCWQSSVNGISNKYNADFWIFSSETELLRGDWHPAWRSCDYDDCDHHVGFPRDCGPRKPVLRNWNCLPDSNPNDCQQTTRFFVRTCKSILPLALATHMGWTFVCSVLFLVGVYLAAGIGRNVHKKGGYAVLKAHGGWTEMLPHRTFWGQLYGLVRDGIHFSLNRGQRGGGRRAERTTVDGEGLLHAKRSRTDPPPPPPNDPPPPAEVPRRRRRGDERKRGKAARKKDGATVMPKAKSGRRMHSQPPPSPHPSTPTTDCSHTAAVSECSEEVTASTGSERTKLEERRDQSVHPSMAKVSVITM
jgi:hypothetical protein